MSESTEPHPEKERKWLGRLAKIAFFVTAFFLVIFTVMANMGGSSDTLRSAVEEYFAQSTGYVTRIEKLNRMSFFPDMAVDVENVQMKRQLSSEEPAILIGRFEAGISFMDATLGTGKIKKFNIAQLSSLPGTILPQSLYIEKAQINDPGEGDTALFEGFGQIGQTDLSFQTDMKAFGLPGHRKYTSPAHKPFTVALDDLGFQGTASFDQGDLTIDNLRLRMPEKVMGGKLAFTRTDPGVTKVGGILEIQDRTSLAPDIVIDRKSQPWKVTGTINAQTFYAADFAKGSPALRFFEKLAVALGLENQSVWQLLGGDIALDLKVARLIVNGEDKGAFETRMSYKDGQLDLGGLQAMLDAEPVIVPQEPQYGPFLQDIE